MLDLAGVLPGGFRGNAQLHQVLRQRLVAVVNLPRDCVALVCQGDKTILLNVFLEELVYAGLTYDSQPELLVLLFVYAKEAAGIVLVRGYHCVGYAAQNVGQMVCLEVFLHGTDELEQCNQIILALELRLAVQAVVAVAAVLFRIYFSKVVQESLSAALVALRISHGLRKKLFSNLLLGHRLALHELLQLEYIVETVKRYREVFTIATHRNGEFTVIEKIYSQRFK